MEHIVLAVNPGSTSTKIALLKGEEIALRETIYHDHAQLEGFGSILEQIPMRKDIIIEVLSKHGFEHTDLSAIVGCGGLLPPVKVGGYKVNRRMLDMIMKEEIPAHASNLGAVIAYEIANPIGKPSFIYDAVSAGAIPEHVKITGFKEITRRSLYHVLNSRATAMKYAENLGKKYQDMNLVVVHMGGGVTAGAHAKGTIADSFADDNGPFAPQRSGGAPLMDFIELCYSGQFTKKEMMKKVRGMGGLRDLLGTSDGMEVQQMVEKGDERAKVVMEALAYQIAKSATALLPALYGECDAIVLTGGLAHNESLVSNIKKYLGGKWEIAVMPGELEMEALAYGGLRILRGEEDASEFVTS